MSTVTTIFDLSENDLREILHRMQPENGKKIDELGIHNLRSRITEWLLKNDFSTMHNFIKDSDGQWKLPEHIDCDTCGRYKVGNMKEVVTILKQPLSSNTILDPEKLEQTVELVEIPLTRSRNSFATVNGMNNGHINRTEIDNNEPVATEASVSGQDFSCWCFQCSDGCVRRCNRCRSCCSCCCCCTPILSCLTCNF